MKRPSGGDETIGGDSLSELKWTLSLLGYRGNAPLDWTYLRKFALSLIQ